MDNFITILAAIFSGIPIILFFIVLKIVLINLPRFEKQINKLHDEKRREIKKLKDFFNSRSLLEKEILDHEIEYLEDYDLQIEGLERKRRFLLDKIPFLKK